MVAENTPKDTIINTMEGLQPQEPAVDINKIQAINEAIVNIPTVFEISGKKIEIKSKPMRKLVEIDKQILEMYKLGFAGDIDEDETTPEYWDKKIADVDRYYNIIAKVIFLIINEDTENPDITVEWIMDNIDPGDPVHDDDKSGLACQIIDAYNAKCSPNELQKKIMGARKF